MRIGRFGARVERFLTRELALVRHGAVLFEGDHHRLQAIDQGRHQRRLLLQELECFVALVRLRMHAQAGGNPGIQLLHSVQALASAQCGKQAEHGRGRHARNRRAERKA